MLDRLRGRMEAILTSLGRAFSKVGLSPTAWTLVGLGLAILAGASYSLPSYWFELMGGMLILAAGFFDIVDGAVARATGRVSKKGGFIDSNLDRVAEVGIFGGILLGGYSTPFIVLVALSGSLLVSYSRAKGDALGVPLSGVGIGERSERLLVVAISSILGLLWLGLPLVAILAWSTFVERSARVISRL